MKAFSRAFALILALGVLTAMCGVVGCSNGSGDITSPSVTTNPELNATPPEGLTNDSVQLGNFQFVFDETSVWVEEVAPLRAAEINVTGYASIVINDFYFNNEERNWYITATIKNISPFTGYDVWVVFHSMGNKFVVNQDGFMWALPPIFPTPQRLPFIAYGKNQPNRVFPPMFQDTRTVIIHQPEGVPKLAPIGFWIDATGKPRRTPGVEDLAVDPVDSPTYGLTGFVWDHQSPSAHLSVWADATELGISNFQLFDDGAHNDGAAGDKIFGAFFDGSGLQDEHVYKITVYAWDPDQNQGENDVVFCHNCEPCDDPIINVPFETIDQGEHSGITEETGQAIYGPDMWEQVWSDHVSIFDPPPPIPPVDFENHMVIGIWGGMRPTNNHHVDIHEILYDPCEFTLTVRYTYTPKNAGCGPLDVITHPFHIVVLPKFEGEVLFAGEEVDCPPPPPECTAVVPWGSLMKGENSGIVEPYEILFHGPDEFNGFWEQHASIFYPPPPPPVINWDMHDVVAVGIGQRMTGGFFCNIENICVLSDQTLGVFYREMIPGPDCNVTMALTQPFHWAVVPKLGLEPQFFYANEVYNCPPIDCVPVDWWIKAEGDQSCEPPNTMPITSIPMLHDVWQGIHCGGPDMPPPPPFNIEEETLFLIQTHEFPTGGFFVTVDDVCIDYQNHYVEVNWTLNIPGPNCPVIQIFTKPWLIGSVPLPAVTPDFQWNFIGHEFVYECPPCDPLPWIPAMDGQWSCSDPGAWGFEGFGDSFVQKWYEVNCYDPASGAPPPPWPIPPPPGYGEWLPFIIQLPERPTGGFFITIDNVCIIECTVIINWTEHIPAPNCPVPDVLTRPWIMGYFEFPPIDCVMSYEFVKHEQVYECPGDCTPVPFWMTADGHMSCAEPGEYGWQYPDGAMGFWAAVNCVEPGDPVPPFPPNPDPIGGGIIYNFGIQLPQRPSSGFFITIDEVCINGCDVFVTYTENIPGPNCVTLPVLTKPWAIGAVELPPVYCLWTWHFTKNEVVYECPDQDCYDFENVAGGMHGGTEFPETWFFDNPQAFHVYWTTYHPDITMPEINWNGGWGAYAIHIGMRPTTGFEVDVYEVCAAENPFGIAVRWHEWIPGPGCPVLQILTFPWRVITMPLLDMPYYDEGSEIVYECD